VSARRILIGLVFVVTAVVIQTTVFARLKPLGVTPMLVLLTVAAVVRYLDPEPAVLTGFTAGILLDLLSESPLGMWAMVMTTVAFLTLRVRDRAEDGPLVIAVGVAGLTVIGAVLFVVLGTIFGMDTLSDLGVVKRIVYPALLNVIAAPVVLPAATWSMGGGRRRRIRL
jgi:rod shape-determining protein MreD